MWVQKSPLNKYPFPIIYENNDPETAKIVKKLMITYEHGISCFEHTLLHIKFTDPSVLKDFYDQFTGLPIFFQIPSNSILQHYEVEKITQNQPSNVHKFFITDNIFFNLSSQKSYDLEKIYEFFLDLCNIPITIIDTIKESFTPRELSIEEQLFYENFANLNQENYQENFETVFNNAKSIVTAKKSQNNILWELGTEFNIIWGLTIQTNVLWELANKCKDLGLIHEWITTLKEIKEHDNYYSKAQEELAYYTLSKMSDAEGSSRHKQLFWFHSGIKYISNIFSLNKKDKYEKDDLVKKLYLSYLKKNWTEQKEIFPENHEYSITSTCEPQSEQSSLFLNKKTFLFKLC